MSLKNIILKSIASTMAVSILFGNVAICGVGISEVIAEDILAAEQNQMLPQNEEDKKDILAFDTQTVEEGVYKGFLYSNVLYKTNYDTKYKTVSILNVPSNLEANELFLELKESKMILSSEEVPEIINMINIEATGIDKQEFDNLLGQEGMIEFYQGEEVLATVKYVEIEKTKKLAVIYLNGETTVLEDAQTALVVEYPEDTTSLKIKTSKPITEGILHFENQNVIKAAEDYEYQIEQIKAITVQSKVNDYESDIQIPLLEPQTKITVTSSNQNFSTLQTSKTTLTVKLDDKNPSAKLFDNPTITVKLPEGITGGKLSSPEIVNGNGLEIKNAIANGNTITIELKGKQTAYDLNNVSEGVSIVMDIEGISFSDTLPTHTDKIEVTCNQNKEQTVESCDVNIVSKPGLLMLSKLSNYDETNKVVSTIDNNVKNVEIKSDLEAKEAMNTLVLVNNYDEKLTNVQIIGKMGNENSTFDTSLAESIELNAKNAKVYYSNNKDAKAEDDSWKEEFTTDAKACKIVLENKEIEKASSVTIKEYLQIPNNIEVNQVSYLNWSVNYQYKGRNLSEENTFKMTTKKDVLMTNATKTVQNVKAENGETIPVSLTVTPVIAQNYVHAGQVVTYKIKVTNNGQTDLENLVLKDMIPENAIYTYYNDEGGGKIQLVENSSLEQYEWKIALLKTGETKTFEIMLKMENVEEQQEIFNLVSLKYNEQNISTNSKLLLKPASILATLDIVGLTSIIPNYGKGDTVDYLLKVRNTTSQAINDAKVQYTIPGNLEYQEGGLTQYVPIDGYVIKQAGQIANNVFEYNIEKLEANSEKEIIIKCKVNELHNGYEATIEGIANVLLDNDVYDSNLKSAITQQAAYALSIQSNIESSTIAKANDEIIYTINVKNIGKRSSSFTIKDTIPSEIEVQKIEYGLQDKKLTELTTSNSDLELTHTLEVGETFIINIVGRVKEIKSNVEEIITINNSVTLINGNSTMSSNIVENKIQKILEEDNNPGPDNPNPDNPDNPNPDDPNPEIPNNPNPINPEEKKYTISGVAWIDENKNGQRDENEKLQDNVIVSLVNKDTGNFAIDENGNKIATTTDTNGKYEFHDILEGNYIVVFEFDTNTYTVTTYQKTNVETDVNSDAISSTVTINGEQKLAAITDDITLNSDKENVDIGLMMNATFDLSLNKQITKVTVSNSKGTEVTEYEEGETAKIDLVAKYMNTAKVIVNYKFTVKNEGDITGYVNSLVDNLPSGLEFSSDLNKDWYKGNDGKLYTTALSSKGINPGETAQIELVLTKNMTEESTGVFPNSAELDKISNLENINEKVEAIDNNQSSATLFISIKTGSAVLYTGIILLSIGILAVGAYFIKKKVLDRGI